MEINTIGQLQELIKNIHHETPIIFYDHDEEKSYLLSNGINVIHAKLNFLNHDFISNYSGIDTEKTKETFIISSNWNPYY